MSHWSLDSHLALALAAALPFASPLVACRGGARPNDAREERRCVGEPPKQLPFTTHHEVVLCADAGGGGVAHDAAADADRCYATCKDACAERSIGSTSSSCAAVDGGTGGRVIAQCTGFTMIDGHNCGRRFAGLILPDEADGEATSAVGRFFARCAWLEGASVHAFRRLIDELRLHDAPSVLVRAARAAMGDEIRHASTMTALARRFGASVSPVRATPPSHRSLEELATENAVEACVGETYGAVVAEWQARHAEDRTVRDALGAIARDEREHAALGWSIAAWLDERLDDDARGRVRGAAREAVTRLAGTLAHEPSPTLVAYAGVPSAPVARALVESLRSSLWSATCSG